MECGVPFCQSHTGCPLGNIIPRWNDLVFQVTKKQLNGALFALPLEQSSSVKKNLQWDVGQTFSDWLAVSLETTATLYTQ